jgi:hypothetical protein
MAFVRRIQNPEGYILSPLLQYNSSQKKAAKNKFQLPV